MQPRMWQFWVLAGMLFFVTGTFVPAADKKNDGKPETVVIDELKSTTPAGWKKQRPSNTFRQYQFQLQRVEGDPADAELVVSNNVLGKTDDIIIERWKKMFVLPEGKTLDDIAKVSKMKAGKAALVYLDMQGTYLLKQKPIDPDFKAEKKANYRMLRVLFKTKNDVNYVSLIGPARTVEQHKKAFDEWLTSFK